MSAPPDRELTHWGEATALFSLDLSRSLAGFLLCVDPSGVDRLREACRSAILDNRASVNAGRGIVSLRQYLQRNLGASFSPLEKFVQDYLVTASRPEAIKPWQAVLLGTDQSDVAVSPHLPQGWREMGMRDRIFRNLSKHAYDRLFELAIETDSCFERKSVTDWDSCLISRNHEMFSPNDPLRLLIYSADMSLRSSASMFFPEHTFPLEDQALFSGRQVGAPFTELDRRRIVFLSREIILANGTYYSNVPVSFVSLQVRDLARSCEAVGIHDPELQDVIMRAVFQPSLVALGYRDMSYVVHLLSQKDASPSGRVKAVLDYLAKRKH